MGVNTRTVNRMNVNRNSDDSTTEKLDFALELATRLHAGQVDKNGVDYIEHPKAVAASVKSPVAKTVALLHDVLEDTDMTANKLRLLRFPEDIVTALELLNHKPGERYLTYIERVMTNDLSREVKIADTKKNSDLSRLHSLSDNIRERLTKKYMSSFPILMEDKWDDVITNIGRNGELAEHAAGISLLLNTSFGMGPDDSHGSWMVQNIVQGKDDQNGIAFFDGDRPIAFVAYRTPSQNPEKHSHGGNYAYISNLAVDPFYRGHGIGNKLMEQLLDDIENRGLDGVFTHQLQWENAPHQQEVKSNSGFASLITRRPIPNNGLFSEESMRFEE